MDDFGYNDAILYCEEIPIPVLARQYGTPLYVYSTSTLLGHWKRFRDAFAPLSATICFSVKCCQNLAILQLLRDNGASFDVVSGGELSRVLEAGGNPKSVVFAGVGKTDDEIRQALRTGIGWFNVESEAELENISAIAASMNVTARAALRVNPDVDPHTHLYTTTGKRETKFGVDLDCARRVFREFHGRTGLNLCGLHLHIGSPVNSVEPYVRAIFAALSLIEELRRDGHSIQAMNIGGGFGAHYLGSEAPPAGAYAAALIPMLERSGLQVYLEPGRCIAANAGVLIARTIYTKSSGDRRFIIVDASITELIRPALYGAYHFAWPVAPAGGLTPPSRVADLRLEGTFTVDIVGPVCESGDFLAKDRRLPPIERGDLICLFSAGAYGMVMSSQYNSRPRAAEVLVDGSSARLIRRRETYDDLVAAERNLETESPTR